MKLHLKIAIFTSVLLGFILLMFGTETLSHFNDAMERQMGGNAMDLAVAVAEIEAVTEGLMNEDQQMVQEKVESIRSKTRFQYIIVMDMNGTQYSYPYEVGLGQPYKNGGEKRVLEDGEAYVSADRNVLISAIRAFVPVYDQDGRQIGAVLVGLLTDTVSKENEFNEEAIHRGIVVGLIIGVLGAWVLSTHIKRSTFGLEPKEIGMLLGQRDIILRGLSSGIIAVDLDGKVLWLSDRAKELFQVDQLCIGRSIKEINYMYGMRMMEVIDQNTPVYHEEFRLTDLRTLHYSITLLKDPTGAVFGAVSSFEDLTEVKIMAQELTGYRELTDTLRAQNHEFMNKLHTISGLVQLERYEEAIDYIEETSERRAALSGILKQQFSGSHTEAIILSKYNWAAENHIDMVIDTESLMTGLPGKVQEDDICSILGNLIDNAGEALMGRSDGRIEVLLQCTPEQVFLRVTDNGPGIDEAVRAHLFEKGFTTKSDGRGLGLAIVNEIVSRYHGVIDVFSDNGTVFIVDIPGDDAS